MPVHQPTRTRPVDDRHPPTGGSSVSNPTARTPVTNASLLISEIFLSIQGEGPSTGKLAIFLRLAGCNLSCSWCDTPYTWDWTGKNGVKFNPRKENKRMVFDEVTAVIRGLAGRRQPRIIITGGEPLLQQDALVELINHIKLTRALGYYPHIEVETNGTQIPSPRISTLISQWNVSPKLAHSGDHKIDTIRPATLEWFSCTAQTLKQQVTVFKFVCQEPADLSEIERLAQVHSIPPESIWIMPEGRDHETITNRLRELAPHAIARGYNLSTRLQVHIWGNTRGT